MELKNQIEQYLEWCVRVADYSPQTIESKRYILERFAGVMALRSMSGFDNEVYFDYKNMLANSPKISTSTANLHLKTLKVFAKWVSECGICVVPARMPYLTPIRAQEERERVWYSRGEIKEVLRRATVREKAMVSLLFESGMRIGEFQMVRLEDIDFDTRSINIVGKGRKRARVFFTAECAFYLMNYINEAGLMSGYLWASERNGSYPYTLDSLRRHLRTAFKRAGIEGVSPHQLRHSFATDLIESGATILQAQRLLRHNSVATTEVYIHELQETLRQTYRTIRGEAYDLRKKHKNLAQKY